MKLRLEPLKGVFIDLEGQEVLLPLSGSRVEVDQRVNKLKASGFAELFSEAILQIHYTSQGLVELLEVYEDDGVEVSLFSRDVFRSEKAVISELLESQGQEVDRNCPEYPISMTYKSCSLGFWSEGNPADFSEEEKSLYAEDYENSKYFKSVAIGIPGYYDNL